MLLGDFPGVHLDISIALDPMQNAARELGSDRTKRRNILQPHRFARSPPKDLSEAAGTESMKLLTSFGIFCSSFAAISWSSMKNAPSRCMVANLKRPRQCRRRFCFIRKRCRHEFTHPYTVPPASSYSYSQPKDSAKSFSLSGCSV